MTSEFEDDILRDLDEYYFLKEVEGFYYQSEMPKVRQALLELRAENKEFATACRLHYLKENVIEIRHEIDSIYKKYEQMTEANESYFVKSFVISGLDALEKKLKRVESEIRFLSQPQNGRDKKDSITPEMIARAKQHPFEDLIEIKKGKVLCPFHGDKNPSMDVRNGYFYCYSCGEKGDIITFVMKRDGMNFKEAVQLLS